MKLILLKILLQRRARDEGFTLPMVIALGLVMILLGVTNIVKSNEENITAINTNSSSDALAIAEVGVARYREFLNQNRILTIYNRAQWSTLAGQTCNDMTTTPPGWEDGGTAATPDATTKWWKVEEDRDNDGTDETIGEYSLVSYIYDNDGRPTATNDNGEFAPDDDDANTTDSFTYNDVAFPGNPNGYNPRGILTVQGRGVDEDGDPNGSEAQIQVEIPLRINNLNNFAPVLWIGDGEITSAQVGDSGDLTISNGNIILSKSGGDCAPVGDIDGNDTIVDPRDIPSIISDPSSIASTKKNDSFTINRSSTGTNSDLLLPRPNAVPDNKGDDGRFLYVVNSDLILNDNNLESDGSSKVTIYVDDKDIDIDGNVKIGPNNNNVSSHYLEIYVKGNKTIDINPGINPDGTSKKVEINAFIHAPNSTLKISGDGEVEINGAVWVNKFNNSGGATVTIAGDRTDTLTGSEPSYKFYTSSEARTPRPVTNNPTNWVREEVQ